MLVLSSLHVHPTVSADEVTCIDCVQHHCNGHMAQQTGILHQCVLCQFLTMTFVAATLCVVVSVLLVRQQTYAQQCQQPVLAGRGQACLRAPPCY